MIVFLGFLVAIVGFFEVHGFIDISINTNFSSRKGLQIKSVLVLLLPSWHLSISHIFVFSLLPSPPEKGGGGREDCIRDIAPAGKEEGGRGNKLPMKLGWRL